MNKLVPPLFAGRHDWLVLAGLLAISLVAWVGHYYDQPVSFRGACKIRIFTDPAQKLVFSGPQAQPIQVNGKIGPATVEWGDGGKIRIVSSACPCKVCVNMGWTDNSSLVCVPNGIIVDPTAAASSEIDAVTR
ncbi:MAG: NusG domain II-containing protein [Candidatus Riflebacteria bacterium]|nr:NusG domain II-containing protein [Candidatus Riflebacteria bacterium]